MADSTLPMELEVLDMHTAGEPVRIVVGGYPELRASTILGKRREARERHDHLRRALMLEPRGHAGMYGVVPVLPSTPDAVIGALFIHNEGYSTMCGHATIAIGRWLVESGRIEPKEPLTRFAVELPCGLIDVECAIEGGRVVSTAFESVPAFLSERDVQIDVPDLGPVRFDIAYGGAFYAILASSSVRLDFFGTPLSDLVRAATRITDAARARLTVAHPDAEDLGFLYGTILTDDAPPPLPTFNLCVFADGQIDRSPTGSGVTARMARDHANGAILTGVARSFLGPTGIPFEGRVVSEARVSGRDTVRVRVSGTSAITGRGSLLLQRDDAVPFGFQLPRSFEQLRGDRRVNGLGHSGKTLGACP